MIHRSELRGLPNQNIPLKKRTELKMRKKIKQTKADYFQRKTFLKSGERLLTWLKQNKQTEKRERERKKENPNKSRRRVYLEANDKEMTRGSRFVQKSVYRTLFGFLSLNGNIQNNQFVPKKSKFRFY